MEKKKFNLALLKEARDFLKELPQPINKKILYNIDRVLGGERNNVLFDKINGTNIWEFRTIFNKMIYRLFAFWDKEEETIIIATHGIVKKAQKTPPKEIAKAEKIRKEYFIEKTKSK